MPSKAKREKERKWKLARNDVWGCVPARLGSEVPATWVPATDKNEHRVDTERLQQRSDRGCTEKGMRASDQKRACTKGHKKGHVE